LLRRAVPSSPRLRSQVFATSQRFLHVQTSRPCFVPHAVPEITPPERSPHRNRAPLSGPHAPLPLFTGVLERTARGLITAGFGRRPRSRAAAWLPPTTMGSLSPRRSATPVCPGPRTAEPSRSASFTRFRSFIPPASPCAPSRVASVRWSMLSWPFAPLKLYSVLASGSPPVRALRFLTPRRPPKGAIRRPEPLTARLRPKTPAPGSGSSDPPPPTRSLG